MKNRKDKKVDLRMQDFAKGFYEAIVYLKGLQADCELRDDWDTLQVSIEMLQGEFEMLPVVKDGGFDVE
jgi:hypothetical protein